MLAADSRVTLHYQQQGTNPPVLIPAFYDNATKLLKVAGQQYIAAVTYGLGSLGQQNPRTAHSFIPEFEKELAQSGQTGRMSVVDFSTKLSDFFMRQWQALMPAGQAADNMIFLVGGYNENEAYGRVYEILIPKKPAPEEKNTGSGVFGLTFGGQADITARLLNAIDASTLNTLQQKFKLNETAKTQLLSEVQAKHALKIPFQFLPLQDCVDLSILLIRTTAQLMKYMTDIRGVGGPIDVATITRTDGFTYVQTKQIKGEDGGA